MPDINLAIGQAIRDGRAIILTEIDVNNRNYTLQLKGAGMTLTPAEQTV
jgi:uncharacterized protein YdiU (UPF0061 family)